MTQPRLRPLYVVVGALTLAACAGGYPPPPETRVAVVVDTIHGVAIPDPYRWLEDQTSPETRAWIDSQNAYAERIIGNPPLRAALRDRLQALMDTPDIGAPTRAGDYEYFTLRRKGGELPVIYRRPAPPRDSLVPIDPGATYEVVLDPTGATPGNTTRYEIQAISPDGSRMIYAVRDGGQDEVEIRVRDLAAGTDLPDRLPNALYSDVSFTRDGTAFYYVYRSRETGPRVRLHRFGTDPARDSVLFGDGIGPDCFLGMDEIADGRYRIYTVSVGWRRNDVYLEDVRAGRLRPLVTGQDARFEVRYHDGKLYIRTNLDAPNNRVVVADLATPEPPHWRDLLPQSDDVLQGYTFLDGKIYATYLHDVSPVIRVFTLDGAPAGDLAVPPYSSVSLRGAGKGRAVLSISTFTTPETTYLVDLATGARRVWQRDEVPFDSTGVVVDQVWYTSNDSTRVPMFVVHRSDTPLDGNRPTLLTGYGGFNVAMTARFNPRAIIWLEHGGVYAFANLRGGSEFGERWHRDGMLANKQHVFDDFIAAAEWLIANKYTNAEKLAIHGESNGGLLVGAALTQRPDLFRAVLCGFPDLDMVRFYTFTRTNNMPALHEYGNAAIPEEFAFLRAYSPYQHVTAGTRYPAVMLMTGDLDTRVPPRQARRMTARLQAATSSGLPVILRYRPKEGHAAGRGRPFSQAVDESAAELTFLLTQLGVSGG
jgi:prolyl oligopeptidase